MAVPAPAVRARPLRRRLRLPTHNTSITSTKRPCATAPSTPILIGRSSPRGSGASSIDRLPQLRELPTARRSTWRRHARHSYQYRADDTALVLRDREATVLNMNDCLLRAGSLDHLLGRHRRIDLLAMSFANAEAYPIVYDFDDPDERVDWDDRARFDGFLEKVRRIAPDAFVPFASMFAFLAPELLAINERIVSPAELIRRSGEGEVKARGLAMNPGDVWTPAHGHEVRNPLDWGRKSQLLLDYADQRSIELSAIRAAEIVRGGRKRSPVDSPPSSGTVIQQCRWPLATGPYLSVRSMCAGGGRHPLARFSRAARPRPPARDGRLGRSPRARRLAPLARAHRRGHLPVLGISCRYRASLRRQVRERGLLRFLLYLHDPRLPRPLELCTPRALGFSCTAGASWANTLQALVAAASARATCAASSRCDRVHHSDLLALRLTR